MEYVDCSALGPHTVHLQEEGEGEEGGGGRYHSCHNLLEQT